MNDTERLAIDNLLIPIIICEKDGSITYKNKAAMRCIKSPRCGANIYKFVKEDFPAPKNNSELVKIKALINYDSTFRRAMVLKTDDPSEREIWVFASELQLYEPEDICDVALAGMERSARHALNFIHDLPPADADKNFNRYQRLGEELLKSMKHMRFELSEDSFPLKAVMDCLMEITNDLLKKLNFRVNFNVPLATSECFYHLHFKAFFAVYAQLLQLLLKISDSPDATINATQISNALSLDISCHADLPKDILPFGKTLEPLAYAFPAEYLNIIMLEQTLKMHNYSVIYTVDESSQNNLQVELTVPLATDLKVHDMIPEIMDNIRKNRAKSILMRYMKSVFSVFEDQY